MRRALTAILASLLLSQAASALDIVKDCKPNAEIIIAENPPRATRLTAHELQTYLEKISGAKLNKEKVNRALELSASVEAEADPGSVFGRERIP